MFIAAIKTNILKNCIWFKISFFQMHLLIYRFIENTL